MSNNKKIVNNFFIFFSVFVLIIIIGFLTMKKPEFEYKISAENTLDKVINDTDFIRPEKAMAIIQNKHPQYRFVDLRNPDMFEKGHLEGAINIPFKDLLNKNYKNILNQSEFINVLYCSNELRSKEAWLLLIQIGYKNNKVMLGGYDFVTDYILDGYETKMGSYPNDKPLYDYAKVVKETKKSPVESAPTTIAPKPIIVKERKQSKVAGGC